MRTLWCHLNAASAIELIKLQPGETASLGEIDGARFTLTDTGIRRYERRLADTHARTGLLRVVSDKTEKTYPIWLNHGIRHAVIYNDDGSIFTAVSKLELIASISKWKESEQWRDECNRLQAAWTDFVNQAQQQPWSWTGWRFRLYGWRLRLKRIIFRL